MKHLQAITGMKPVRAELYEDIEAIFYIIESTISILGELLGLTDQLIQMVKGLRPPEGEKFVF